MNRRLTVLAVMTMLLGLLVVPGAGAYESGETVRVRGEETFKVNQRVQSTLRFHDKAKVASGDIVTWVREDSGEPHTISVSDAEALPQSFEDPCPACELALGHVNERFEPTNPVLNEGADGFDQVGDSLWMDPSDDSVATTVSAPAGTTLSYLCAIHPWMQGTIEVR